MSLSKSELHRVVHCAIRFVTACGVGICLHQTAQAVQSDATSNLFTDAEVKIGKRSFDPKIEDDYLPRALQAQENAAGFNINPEALKALAVADRSLLYYSLKAKGEIASGDIAPVYDPNLPFIRASDQAVYEPVELPLAWPTFRSIPIRPEPKNTSPTIREKAAAKSKSLRWAPKPTA
jgi:hypothetical protein